MCLRSGGRWRRCKQSWVSVADSRRARLRSVGCCGVWESSGRVSYSSRWTLWLSLSFRRWLQYGCVLVERKKERKRRGKKVKALVPGGSQIDILCRSFSSGRKLAAGEPLDKAQPEFWCMNLGQLKEA